MRNSVVLLSSLVLAACAPEADSEGESGASAVESNGDPDSNASEDTSLALAESGWMVVGQDGAVYTTMLDPDGTYRDFRNGNALQSGKWERRESGDLCFIPSDEMRAGDCWSFGKLGRDNTLRATDSKDHAVELRRINYIAADDAANDRDED